MRLSRRLRWPALSHWTHQGSAYQFFGLVQLLLDTAVFVLLTSLGVAVVPANIAGRIVGACLGFMLNGRVTFGTPGADGINRHAFARFVLLWMLLTMLGSGMLHMVQARFGIVETWYAKPLVEALLAVLGFAGLKFFVFRTRRPTAR